MALTSSSHQPYKKTLSTSSNYSIHSTSDLLLPLPSKSLAMKMSSKDRSWFDFLVESPPKTVKDETYDCDITDATSPLTENIDYTIIDSDDHYSNDRRLLKILDGKIKKSRKKTVPTKRNPLANFDHRSTSSPNQTSPTIKQQPFSPPPYHPLTNGYFNHHRHHLQQQQQQQQSSTPSPDHEQISPLSNNLAESSSTSSLVVPPSLGTASVAAEDKRRCAVCSCKAFFKRSIQGTNEYICPATNTCTIDKHRRKSCQACRLRRCYEVGMTKGTTRRERKYRKKAVSVCKITSTSSNTNALNNSTGNNTDQGLLIATNMSAAISAGTSSVSQINNAGFSSPQLQTNKTTTDPTRMPLPSAEFITTLSQASRLNLPAKADTTRPLTDQYFLQLLAKIFDQELVVLINWAKAMPGYTESLTLDQQVTIIEQSWLDTLILDIIERSLERNDDTLHFAPDFFISRNRDLSSPGLGAICTSLFNILQAFKDPRTTHEEFIALKATILINSIPATITTTRSFRLLTNQIYQAIQYTCDSNPSVYHDNYIRHFTLLLQLPHIKMLSLKLIRLFILMRSNDLLPQADLLLEMLDAQDSLDLNNGFLSMNTNISALSTDTSNLSQNLSTNNNNENNTTSSVTVPSSMNSTKLQPGYQTSNNFNQIQETDDQTPNMTGLNSRLKFFSHQMNYQATSSSMLYANSSSGKRSPATPPVQYYKHSHSESISNSTPTNMHFQMNNMSY
ncbi:hypothetical protein I4U23_007356 [Adineta vaga]|nr:hypothetical protein I4U23_007356 [Adineta vaga]